MTKEQYISKKYMNEDQFSAATFQYINNNYPKLRGLFFHVANGGYRDKNEAAKMKSMGIVPGIHDYVCVCPLFGLELKMPNGILSPSQKNIHAIWTEAGVPHYTAYSPIEVINILEITIPQLKNQKV